MRLWEIDPQNYCELDVVRHVVRLVRKGQATERTFRLLDEVPALVREMDTQAVDTQTGHGG